MPVTIHNLTDRIVFLVFNSGKTCHLGARAALSDVLESDVRDNFKMRRLEQRQLIQLVRVPPTGVAEEAPSSLGEVREEPSADEEERGEEERSGRKPRRGR